MTIFYYGFAPDWGGIILDDSSNWFEPLFLNLFVIQGVFLFGLSLVYVQYNPELQTDKAIWYVFPQTPDYPHLYHAFLYSDLKIIRIFVSPVTVSRNSIKCRTSELFIFPMVSSATSTRTDSEINTFQGNVGEGLGGQIYNHEDHGG